VKTDGSTLIITWLNTEQTHRVQVWNFGEWFANRQHQLNIDPPPNNILTLTRPIANNRSKKESSNQGTVSNDEYINWSDIASPIGAFSIHSIHRHGVHPHHIYNDMMMSLPLPIATYLVGESRSTRFEASSNHLFAVDIHRAHAVRCYHLSTGSRRWALAADLLGSSFDHSPHTIWDSQRYRLIIFGNKVASILEFNDIPTLTSMYGQEILSVH
jgi:hypothetical protein